MTEGNEKRKMARAVHMMIHTKSKTHGDHRNYRLTSQAYQKIREEYFTAVRGWKHSEESRRKMSIAITSSKTPKLRKHMSDIQRGKKLSIEHRRKISEAAKRQMSDPIMKQRIIDAARNRPPVSDSTKNKMKISSANRDLTPELRDKFKTAKIVWTGQHHSEESRSKISLAKLGKPSPMKGHLYDASFGKKISLAKQGKTPKQVIVTCPHCGKSGASTIMPRYHFNKCSTKT